MAKYQQVHYLSGKYKYLVQLVLPSQICDMQQYWINRYNFLFVLYMATDLYQGVKERERTVYR